MGNMGVFSLVVLSLLLFNGESLSQGPDSRVRDSVLSLPIREREHLQKSPYMYERYNLPVQCYFTAMRGISRYRRNLRTDTMLVSRTQDTVPSDVKEVVKSCMEKFDMNKLPPQYVIGAYAASVYQGDYEKANLAFQKFLKDYPQNDSSQKRRKALMVSKAGKTEMWVNPDAVKRLLERGKIAEDLGMPLYADPYEYILEIAKDLLMPDVGIDGARRYVSAWTKWTNEEIMDWGDPRRSFNAMIEFSAWKNGLEASKQMVHNEFVPMLHARTGGGPEKKKAVEDMFSSSLRWLEPIGTAPPMLARYWFDSTGKITDRVPKPGRVTLVFPSEPELGGNDYYRIHLLREMHKKFHDKGLDIVILTRLKGHFRLQIIDSKEEELELLRKYYLEHLNLPVTLAVDDVRFSKRFDGARMPEEIPWRRTWPTLYVNKGLIVGRDGNFFSTELDHNWWRRSFHLVEEALAQKVE